MINPSYCRIATGRVKDVKVIVVIVKYKSSFEFSGSLKKAESSMGDFIVD